MTGPTTRAARPIRPGTRRSASPWRRSIRLTACLLAGAWATGCDDGQTPEAPTADGGGMGGTGGMAGMGGTGGMAGMGGTGGMAGMGGAPFDGVGLRVPSEARACEAVVRDPAGVLRGAIFGAGIDGRVVERTPRHALAWRTTGDGPMPDGAVELRVDGDAGSLELMLTRCYGADGMPLPGAEVSAIR